MSCDSVWSYLGVWLLILFLGPFFFFLQGDSSDIKRERENKTLHRCSSKKKKKIYTFPGIELFYHWMFSKQDVTETYTASFTLSQRYLLISQHDSIFLRTRLRVTPTPVYSMWVYVQLERCERFLEGLISHLLDIYFGICEMQRPLLPSSSSSWFSSSSFLK